SCCSRKYRTRKEAERRHSGHRTRFKNYREFESRTRTKKTTGPSNSSGGTKVNRSLQRLRGTLLMEQTFVGVPLGQETTVFYRESPRGLEGFVVDNVALVDALKQRVLEERGLSELVEVTSRGGPELDGSGFSHQFAEPFSAVFAQLRLAPLEIPWFERLLVPLSL